MKTLASYIAFQSISFLPYHHWKLTTWFRTEIRISYSKLFRILTSNLTKLRYSCLRSLIPCGQLSWRLCVIVYYKAKCEFYDSFVNLSTDYKLIEMRKLEKHVTWSVFRTCLEKVKHRDISRKNSASLKPQSRQISGGLILSTWTPLPSLVFGKVEW